MGEISVPFNDYIDAVNPRYNYNNQLAIAEISGSNDIYKNFDAIRIDAFSVFLTCKGEVHLNIDYLSYCFKKNTILTLSNFHLFENFDSSPDFKGYLLIASKDWIEQIIEDIKNIPIPDEPGKMHPIKVLNDDDFNHLLDILFLIQNRITEEHVFKDNVLKCLFGIFLFDMINIFFKLSKDTTVLMKEINRKEEIVINFLKLLRENAREKHEVTFYSNELCITPEYLSKVMKAFSGKTVNKWIAEALLAEAKILLRKPNTSIQQISDMLCFSEQSSFSKFFKKHTGKSPLEYKSSSY